MRANLESVFGQKYSVFRIGSDGSDMRQKPLGLPHIPCRKGGILIEKVSMAFFRSSIHSIRSRFTGPAIILMAAALAVTPQLIKGNSCGHDFDFHLISWLDAANSWRHGILYPHWAASANFGAGEPRFLFYPPLTWMLGAALGFILPWTLVPIALTFLLLAGTGLATRALAREYLPEGAATLAGCAALFSGYALFTAYERTAFGELAGGFWIPLLLLFALRESRPFRAEAEENAANSTSAGSLWRRALDGSLLPLSLVVAGCWLSNAPVGVMSCYLLGAVAVAAALLHRSWDFVLRAAAAALIGTGLASFYLLPAAWEQRWVDIRQAIDDPGERIESSWLFARHADPSLAAHDTVLLKVSFLAASMIAVALFGAMVGWLRRASEPAAKRQWLLLALIPPAILFLQLPVSLPLWNLLPKLRFLQFPWRWLVVLEAPMAIFFAAAVWPRTKLWLQLTVSALCAAFFLSATVFAAHDFFQVCDSDDAVSGMMSVYRSGAGFQGTGEYAPPGADNSNLASGLPQLCLVSDPGTLLGLPPADADAEDAIPAWTSAQGSCDTTLNWQLDEPERYRLQANLPHPGFLVLRLRSYPAWRVIVNGRPAASLPQRDDGLIAVAVPQGPIVLTVDWNTTRDVVAARWLSALAVFLLTGLWLLRRNLRQPHLS
jgi:hypothetical protein